ncbi:50S ribosomal protein L35ae [Candidatus Woesearchaeota archaeon]|nr:50S ribosomal protein L35ae [Candidatus Woesearchaeota archaeon]
MDAVISNFRSSRHRQTGNQMVIYVSGVDNREQAAALVGKSVVWKTPAGKEMKGTITGAHGNSGAVRAHFETGMPGQAVGTKIDVKHPFSVLSP